MSLVFVGMGFMAFLAATTLAIDVGMFMNARSQAQNSADAGALAGAVALGFDDYDDRSADGPAVQNALEAATENQVAGANVSIGPDDVTFPLGPTGLDNRVRVRVFRTAARGNPLLTLMGGFFGVDSANMEAMATAEASPANAMTCVKPFIIPDKWREVTDPPFDPMNSTFEMYDNKENPLPNPDVYIDAFDKANYTGYNQEANRGDRMVIRAGSGNNINPTFYYSLAMGVGSSEENPGGLTGGAAYEWNIANCNTTTVGITQVVIQEPGNMMGPTIAGAQELVARDPGASWDSVHDKVVGSAFPAGKSPRVFPIPLYDPVYYAEGKHNGRYADFKVGNFIGYFLEEVDGNQLVGRIFPIAGIRDTSFPTPDGAFPVVIRLVE
jgi:hypothetical protein